MEIAISIIAKIVEYTVKPVGRQLGYLYYYNDNIKDLADQIERLKDARESVQDTINVARRNAEDIKSNVKNWLVKVDTIIEHSEMIVGNELVQTNNKCSSGLCLNLVQRHQLSRKARKRVAELLEIQTIGNFITVACNLAVSGSWSSAKAPDFLSFESREPTMEQIIDVLKDESVNRIGVYGMGGVGKTMLVKEISRRVKMEKLFDEVVMSTVNQTTDVKKIQGELGEQLGLTFEQKTIHGRAIKLCKRLKMDNKILVVLDNIWNYIDLETIGIPSVVDHKGCKILFTSRDKHVLLNEICADKFFEIKVLQQEEPWKLFKEMNMGEVVEASNLKPIATQIVNECAQLPIAITTVARALRNKPSSIWRDALNQLTNRVTVNIRGMNEKVYSSLKLSYEQLECEEAKLLFLLCSMFPQDFLINVEDLHIYTMSLGLLQGVYTLTQGRHRIKKLVDDLISSSLLQEFEFGDNYVKMHDMIRDLAVSIASKDDRIRTLSYVKGLSKWKEEKILPADYTAVYLYFGDLSNPPEKLMLPKVQLLMLYGPLSDGHKLPRTFFEEMRELKVMELKDMKISLSHLSAFANLRSLHLLNCELSNIDMIGELKKLKILSFKGSDIIQIPNAISQLTKLKGLDLSFCRQLKVIPSGILRRLTKLEELNLESFDEWEGEESNIGRKNASLSELKYLPYLSALNLCIQDEKILPKQLFSKELYLEKFQITIGRRQRYYGTRSYRMLYLEMESRGHLDDWIEMLLKRSEELYLVGSVATRILRFELDENESSSHLKHLHLDDNPEIQHFIHENKQPFWEALSILESLSLSKLENLENIIHSQVKESPFNKLRFVRVEQCNKLRNLFFRSIMNDFLNLETIEINDCEMVEVIIAMESTGEPDNATNKVHFTHLNSLILNGLPRLTSFCSRIQEFGQLSLDGSETVAKSKGKRKFGDDSACFNNEVSLPNLENLIITNANNLKMICHSVLLPHSFVKLKSVEIASCNNLEKVFPSNIITVFTCLRILTIKNCDLLEGIFEVQESNAATEKCDKILLPQLNSLKLLDLPNLKYVWREDPQELVIFENMEDLSIHRCPKLKRVYPVKVLQQLEKLEIEYGELMEILGKEKESNSSKAEIIESWHRRELFPKLKSLDLLGSSNDKWTHLPPEFVPVLHNLEQLGVRKAFFVEIFPNERSINVEEGTQNERFYHLRRLTLSELPKLTHLWKEISQNNTPLLQNLAVLDVRKCGRLNFLVPSSASLRNLTRLSIHECHRLVHLLKPSVARALVKLESMDLGGCKRMSTVISASGGEDDDNEEEIVFNELEDLRLVNLPGLTCFYAGKCNIRFPCLDSVNIMNCPEMKVFSLSTATTSHLLNQNIQLYGNGQYFLTKDSEEIINVEDINGIVRLAWENDYGANIQYLFTQQNAEVNQFDHSSSSYVDESESD